MAISLEQQALDIRAKMQSCHEDYTDDEIIADIECLATAIAHREFELAGVADRVRRAVAGFTAVPREKKVDEALEDKIDQVLVEFFQTTGKRKVLEAANHRGNIRARLKEGGTAEQAIAVIRAKHDEWWADPSMRKYVRPETLFNKTNFWKYVDELDPALKDDHGIGHYRDASE